MKINHEIKTYQDLQDYILKIIENNDYDYIGLRFEDKDRNIGDKVEDYSRHNSERDDERDFPEFGTESYNEMTELDGISCWNCSYDYCIKETVRINKAFYEKLTDKINGFENRKHAYLIAGNEEHTHSDCDYNEIVITNGVVIDIIF